MFSSIWGCQVDNRIQCMKWFWRKVEEEITIWILLRKWNLLRVRWARTIFSSSLFSFSFMQNERDPIGLIILWKPLPQDKYICTHLRVVSTRIDLFELLLHKNTWSWFISTSFRLWTQKLLSSSQNNFSSNRSLHLELQKKVKERQGFVHKKKLKSVAESLIWTLFRLLTSFLFFRRNTEQKKMDELHQTIYKNK